MHVIAYFKRVGALNYAVFHVSEHTGAGLSSDPVKAMRQLQELGIKPVRSGLTEAQAIAAKKSLSENQ